MSKYIHVYMYIYVYTRSLGALRAPTSNLWPFGPSWLRPSRPSGAQAVWPALTPSTAAAAPPIESMVKFRYQPTNEWTKKAILGVGCVMYTYLWSLTLDAWCMYPWCGFFCYQRTNLRTRHDTCVMYVWCRNVWCLLACLHDACTNDACTHDACIHDACM